jgi:hypothetical protein
MALYHLLVSQFLADETRAMEEEEDKPRSARSTTRRQDPLISSDHPKEPPHFMHFDEVVIEIISTLQ